MKLIITAFEPFGGESVNPAQLAVQALPENIAGAALHRLVLPVSFGHCFEPLRRALHECRPDAVLCIGQAGGRFQITPERVAINCMDARIADNDGVQPQDQPVVPGGPAAYFSTLPLRGIEHALLQSNIPAGISNTAGTYVCNALMYQLLHECALHMPQVMAGFIHMPYMTAQVLQRPATPSLSPEQLVQGLTAAVQAVAAAKGQA